jgi:SAM-dependent methyltransferase
VVDRRAFRSDRLPVDHFDARFSDENLAFWTPVLVEAAAIRARDRVLDVGCGTGGYSRSIAAATASAVTGLDESERFVAAGREAAGDVELVVGAAERLPYPDESFDAVLLSLVLHLALVSTRRVLRNARLGLGEVEAAIEAERARYDDLTDAEFDEALRRLREDGGPWVDPRPNTILVATRC